MRGQAEDELWSTQPNTIRKFLDLRPKYEKLGQEVAFVLEALLRAEGISFATVSHRTKKLDSFCEKVVRKKYSEPLSQVTDLSGVRIVYLYKSDRAHLETLIENTFKILEKVDTIKAKNAETFGYGALHYLAHLGPGTHGPRYDEVKDLVCEIQVRTILQDAWAIIAHHLSYKKEEDIAPELRRKLNALSGAFETADDQFDLVRNALAGFAARLEKEATSDPQEFLDAALSLDGMLAFLAWKFPKRERASRKDVAALLDELRTLGCRTLRDVDAGIERALPAVRAQEKKYPPLDERRGRTGAYVDVGVTRVAFYFLYKGHREKKITDPEFRTQYSEFEHLVR